MTPSRSFDPKRRIQFPAGRLGTACPSTPVIGFTCHCQSGSGLGASQHATQSTPSAFSAATSCGSSCPDLASSRLNKTARTNVGTGASTPILCFVWIYLPLALDSPLGIDLRRITSPTSTHSPCAFHKTQGCREWIDVHSLGGSCPASFVSCCG
ncbi:hypothetical protein BDP27DRAFT_607488 [Rhodocollybia butyracea]|uniref:Uncharacterized protein n=1 Tax=Rhodocollybia butyracea TaxID=206335 RepID=A0A9P5Q9A3_9AGAR|nr:hypothetical protein BDP27DRAFT_607488 [Rhodocollybia butyracea]